MLCLLVGATLAAVMPPWLKGAQGGTDVQVADPPATLPANKVGQNEISLTHTPGTIAGQPAVLLAAYNDGTASAGLGVSSSTDGGATWSVLNLALPTYSTSPPPPSPPIPLTMVDAFDPTVAADTQGNLYAGHISTDNTIGGYSGLFVHKSTNGGVTFLSPTTVSLDVSVFDLPPNPPPAQARHRFNDRCQMVVDTFANPGSNTDNIYIAWIKDRGLNQPQPFSDIYFARSTDGGASFSLATGIFDPSIPGLISGRINDLGLNLENTPVPAVAPDGTVYVSWLDFDVSQTAGGIGTIHLDKSTDGGISWGTDLTVRQINVGPRNLNGGTEAKSFGAPVLVVSPTNPNELYIIYAEDPAGTDEADIFFIKSTDGGGS